MKHFIKLIIPLMKQLFLLDLVFVFLSSTYILLFPQIISLEPRSGFFAFLFFFGAAFCFAQLLRRNNSIFILAARLPIRYDRFFVVFLLYYLVPVILYLSATALIIWTYQFIRHPHLNTYQIFFKLIQCAFAIGLIKIFSIHLLLLFNRNIAWLVGYFTLAIAILFGLKLIWDFINYPAVLFAAAYLSAQIILIPIAIHKGFHRF